MFDRLFETVERYVVRPLAFVLASPLAAAFGLERTLQRRGRSLETGGASGTSPSADDVPDDARILMSQEPWFDDDFPYERSFPGKDAPFPDQERYVREVHRDEGERQALRKDWQELSINDDYMHEAANRGDFAKAGQYAKVCRSICDKIGSYIFFASDRAHWKNMARSYGQMEKRYKKLAGQGGFLSKLFG